MSHAIGIMTTFAKSCDPMPGGSAFLTRQEGLQFRDRDLRTV
jgi:hypothetical protein